MMVGASRVLRCAVLLLGLVSMPSASLHAEDLLPSWNPGPAKEAIVSFVYKAWDEAKERGWTVVSMKQDWKTVYAFQETRWARGRRR